MPKKRRTPSRKKLSVPKIWQSVGLGLLALVAVLLAVVAFRPSSPAVTPEMVAEGKAAYAELAAERKAQKAKAAEAAAARPDAVVIGDSMSAGANNKAIWPELVAEHLGFRLELTATGGAAYTQERKPFSDQVKAITLKSPEVIFVAGSVNDRKTDPAVIVETASQLLSGLKKKYPEAEIIAVGPIAPSVLVSTEIQRANTAVKDAAARAGVTYWDALGDEWLRDMGLIQSDKLHPTDAGHAEIAKIVSKRLADANYFGGNE